MARRVMAVIGGLVMVGALAACASTNDAAQPSRTVAPGTLPATTTTAPPVCTPAEPLTVDAGKPTVEVPDGPAPTELVTTDLTVGDGPVAAVGDTVQMQYVGVSYSNGEEFDASWKTGTPLEVTLGQGRVIPGWEQGIPGMALGGRRQLVIPPDLAYGEGGQGAIAPNETLVFVVDLVQVCTPASTVPNETPASSVLVPPTGGTGDATSTTVATQSSTTTQAESTTTTSAG